MEKHRALRRSLQASLRALADGLDEDSDVDLGDRAIGGIGNNDLELAIGLADDWTRAATSALGRGADSPVANAHLTACAHHLFAHARRK